MTMAEAASSAAAAADVAEGEGEGKEGLVAAGDGEGQFIGEKLAPFNPSSEKVIEFALEFFGPPFSSGSAAGPAEAEAEAEAAGAAPCVWDLGCGDGRVLLAAVAAGGPQCSGRGVEYDAEFARRAREAVATAGVEDRVEILHDNVVNVNFEDSATHIFVYLVPKGMRAMRERLVACLRRGVPVVSYVFSLPDATPQRVREYKGTKVYLYTAESITS